MPYSDPAKLKARNRAYYLKHRDEIIAHVRNYVELNRDKVASCQRQKYLRNKNQISKKSKEERANDPDKFRARDRSNYAKNVERKREIDRCRYIRDKEKRKRAARQYSKENPDKRSDAQQRRRALKKGVMVEQVLRSEILSRDGPSCVLCGVETIQPIHKKYRPNDRHYDHVVPLIRGGKHSMDNMRILCASCNTSKQHRLDSELPLSFGVKKHVA